VGAPTTSLQICEDTTFDRRPALLGTGSARALDPTTRFENETEQFPGSAEIGQKTPGGKPTTGTIDV
jgi:hypothetical protein